MAVPHVVEKNSSGESSSTEFDTETKIKIYTMKVLKNLENAKFLSKDESCTEIDLPTNDIDDETATVAAKGAGTDDRSPVTGVRVLGHFIQLAGSFRHSLSSSTSSLAMYPVSRASSTTWS